MPSYTKEPEAGEEHNENFKVEISVSMEINHPHHGLVLRPCECKELDNTYLTILLHGNF